MAHYKNFKTSLALLLLATVSIGSYGIYLYFMPHRDVQATQTDYSLQASDIVNQYLKNPEQANETYLDAEGDSKVLEVSGIVSEISEDFNGNKVVLLKTSTDKAGVSCTYYSETNHQAIALRIGEHITIKGVIRSGASYDEDLGMYENVIMEKCANK